MKLERYETSTARVRLGGQLEQRGTRTGFSTLGGLLFGIPFMTGGIVTLLVGTKVLQGRSVHVYAPYWVVSVAGLVFVISGLLVWSMAWRQLVARRRRLALCARHPDEPAFADYAWDPEGFTAPRWKRARKAVLVAAGMTLFLSIFNWWAFQGGGPWMVKAIVGAFDVVLFVLYWQAGKSLARSSKFGGSRIRFERFPCLLGEPVLLHWLPAPGIARAEKGTFTLRCVEEWFERRGSGRNASTAMLHEELWHGTWHLEEACFFEAGETVELRFELPADARSTHLDTSAITERGVFWELEVRLELPGLDFDETYLVPVYAARLRPT